MEQLFVTLVKAVEGSGWVALSASLIWGILSIVLSPCHLASIPLIVAFIDEQGKITTKRAFWLSFAFAGGILITIAIIGMVTAYAGKIAGNIGFGGNLIVAIVFVLVGLHFWGVVPMPWSGMGKVKMNQKGIGAALVLGLIFGIALGPCSFAFLAPIIGVVFQLGASDILFGSMLLLAYGVGHCSVIVLAGTSAEMVQRYLNWNETSKGTMIIKKVCGGLIILGAIYIMIK